ncbi:MAG TPA: phycobiliprotein lyase [Crinalium sp.]|jgi:hypothetical protein
MTSLMPGSLNLTTRSSAALIQNFFQQTSGDWRSERRYYTLPSGDTQEIISMITVKFLAPGSDELLQLAQIHQLADESTLLCGSYVTWDSKDAISGRHVSDGTTIFGVSETQMYRDRGYATLEPVLADFHLPNPETLQLRTEYNNSLFEEEIRLVGSRYRTRQTIVTKAGKQRLIGQYLETRLS